MTSESLSNPFPATPTYVNVEGQLVTKLHLLQTEMKQKELELHETLRYLETQQQANHRVTLETPGPHSLQAKSLGLKTCFTNKNYRTNRQLKPRLPTK